MAQPNKQKFILNPNPTFPCVVDIPLHGGGTAPVEFQFKHRTKEQFKEFFDKLHPKNAKASKVANDGLTDVEVLLDMASGWDLDEPFDAASLQKLCENYIAAPQAITQAYFVELTGARVKN